MRESGKLRKGRGFACLLVQLLWLPSWPEGGDVKLGGRTSRESGAGSLAVVGGQGVPSHRSPQSDDASDRFLAPDGGRVASRTTTGEPPKVTHDREARRSLFHIENRKRALEERRNLAQLGDRRRAFVRVVFPGGKPGLNNLETLCGLPLG